MERRKFILTTAAAATASLAGCTGGTSHTQANGAWDDFEGDESTGDGRLSGTMTLDSGEFASRYLEPDQPLTYEIEFEVLEGGGIDVLFLDRDEYDDRYRDAEADEVEFYSALSVLDSTGDAVSGRLDAGDYVLVMANTGAFSEGPDGEVTVDLQVTSSLSAARNLESARENIGEAAAIIGDDADAETDEFNADAVAARLDDAEADLDAAEPNATDDQQTEIDQLREFTAWIRAMAEAMDSIEEGLDSFDTASSYYDTERYDDAAAGLDDAERQFEDAADGVQVARDEFDGLDDALLNEYGSVTGTEAMDELEALIDTMIAFTRGFRDLNRGFERFQAAADAFDNEEWEASIEPFQTARDHFDDAESTFRDSEEDAPPDVVSAMIGLTCLSGAMRDGCDHFVEAARAANRNRHSQAEDEIQQATEAIEQCE